MGQDHPPTIPSQLMDYGDIAPTNDPARGAGPSALKLVLRVLVGAVVLVVLYKLVRS